MAVKLNQVVNILIKKDDRTSIVNIITEFAVLKQKLENTENQSWYFKKSLDNKNQRLLTLNKKFEEIRTLFNENTLDYFIERLNEESRKYEEYRKNRQYSLRSLILPLYENKIFGLNEMISLKSKIDFLEPMEYYIQNPEEFLTLSD